MKLPISRLIRLIAEMRLPISRLIAVGIPLAFSLISLLLGYSQNPNDMHWLFVGWGVLFLSIMLAYHEWNQEKFLNAVKAVKRRHSYEVMQEKFIPLPTQIETIIQSAKPGDEIFCTATFPFRIMDYEKKLVDKIVKLADKDPDNSNTIFTRVISNSNNQETSEWIRKMGDPADPLYSRLHDLIRKKRVKIYITPHAVGLDLLMVAGPGHNRKIAILGIKEQHHTLYKNDGSTNLALRGRTFVFEDDDMADSICNYYVHFICSCLDSSKALLIINDGEKKHEPTI